MSLYVRFKKLVSCTKTVSRIKATEENQNSIFCYRSLKNIFRVRVPLWTRPTINPDFTTILPRVKHFFCLLIVYTCEPFHGLIYSYFIIIIIIIIIIEVIIIIIIIIIIMFIPEGIHNNTKLTKIIMSRSNIII